MSGERGIEQQHKTKNIPASVFCQNIFYFFFLNQLFFHNLKQLLRIKSFIGISRNAVETQIWTAMITMLLFMWLKHIARYKWALANLAFLATTEYIPQIDLYKWLNGPFTPPPEEENPA